MKTTPIVKLSELTSGQCYAWYVGLTVERAAELYRLRYGRAPTEAYTYHDAIYMPVRAIDIAPMLVGKQIELLLPERTNAHLN